MNAGKRFQLAMMVVVTLVILGFFLGGWFLGVEIGDLYLTGLPGAFTVLGLATATATVTTLIVFIAGSIVEWVING